MKTFKLLTYYAINGLLFVLALFATLLGGFVYVVKRFLDLIEELCDGTVQGAADLADQARYDLVGRR